MEAYWKMAESLKFFSRIRYDEASFVEAEALTDARYDHFIIKQYLCFILIAAKRFSEAITQLPQFSYDPVQFFITIHPDIFALF